MTGEAWERTTTAQEDVGCKSMGQNRTKEPEEREGGGGGGGRRMQKERGAEGF